MACPTEISRTRTLILTPSDHARSELGALLSAEGLNYSTATGMSEALTLLLEAALNDNPYHLVLVDETSLPGSSVRLTGILGAEPLLKSIRLLDIGSLQQVSENGSKPDMARILGNAFAPPPSGSEAGDPGPGPISFDPAALENLRAVEEAGQQGFVAEMIQTFLDQSEQQVSLLTAALAEQDLEVVRKTAHTLKSAAAAVGAMKLSQLCRDLECAARMKTGDFETLIAAIASELPQVSKLLKKS